MIIIIIIDYLFQTTIFVKICGVRYAHTVMSLKYGCGVLYTHTVMSFKYGCCIEQNCIFVNLTIIVRIQKMFFRSSLNRYSKLFTFI